MFNEKWKFLGVDGNGEMWLFVDQPSLTVRSGGWDSDGDYLYLPRKAFHDFDSGKLYKLVGGMPTRTGCD